MKKPILWLVLADMQNPGVPAVLPAIHWMAECAGARAECYLEAERGGALFATYGSTVLGGMHHQHSTICARFSMFVPSCMEIPAFSSPRCNGSAFQ